MTTTNETNPKTPTWLEAARRFYAPGFEVQTDKALSASHADWAELPEDQRSFTIAHLLYLNLVAQRGTQRLLAEVRDLLDEVADGLTEEDDDEPPPSAPAAAPEVEVIVPGEEGAPS